jgi:glycosyltransferase involved in cell wall biosynthesis
MTSRFPKLSETFVFYEILEMERQGVHIEVFPLVREHERVMHPGAQALVDRTHYSTVFSLAVIAAQFSWLLRQPRVYLRAWRQALRGNLGSRKFFVRALVITPQAAWMALEMQRLGVEHIHAHWATHPTLGAYVIHALTGIPYSFTAHAHDIYVDRTMLAEKIRAASFVAAISEYNRRLLHDLYGAISDRVVVIHCGADLSVFKPRPEQPRSGPFTFVTVARLEEMKGHAYLIDAYAQLKQQGVDFRALFIGEGKTRAAIEEQIARLGLGDRISLLGLQPRDRVSELVSAADVVVMPSITASDGHQEGIPVALMEALATERPVVATAISGIPELVIDGQTGLLTPERDSNALAAALLRLCQEPELRRALGAAGRAKVLAEFDMTRTAAQLKRMLLHDWSTPTQTNAQTFFQNAVSPEG